MLLYPERLDDEETENESCAALACFGHGVVNENEGLSSRAAVRTYPAIPETGSRSDRPEQRLERAPFRAANSRSAKSLLRVFCQVIVVAALTAGMAFLLARAPSSQPFMPDNPDGAPPDLTRLALDAVPIAANW